MPYEHEDIEALENHATANKLPIEFLILFFGLILFGIVYFARYTPAISGWTQTQQLEESVAE